MSSKINLVSWAIWPEVVPVCGSRSALCGSSPLFPLRQELTDVSTKGSQSAVRSGTLPERVPLPPSPAVCPGEYQHLHSIYPLIDKPHHRIASALWESNGSMGWPNSINVKRKHTCYPSPAGVELKETSSVFPLIQMTTNLHKQAKQLFISHWKPCVI